MKRVFNNIIYPYAPSIVIMDDKPVSFRVQQVKELIRKEQEFRERQKNLEIKKKEARQKKSKLQRFEKLKKELEAEGKL